MPNAHPQDVTRLLDAWRDGDPGALDALLPLVYEELHGLAQRQRRRWKGNYTLNTTALVHEAYLKLVDQERADWEGRAHFLATAAQAMRHILMNYARDCRAQKRGGSAPRLPLDAVIGTDREVVLTPMNAEVLMDLDNALQRLEQVSPRQSRIVECRFFGSMTIPETAAALGISTASVSRGWALAQAWLYRELQETQREA